MIVLIIVILIIICCLIAIGVTVWTFYPKKKSPTKTISAGFIGSYSHTQGGPADLWITNNGGYKVIITERGVTSSTNATLNGSSLIMSPGLENLTLNGSILTFTIPPRYLNGELISPGRVTYAYKVLDTPPPST